MIIECESCGTRFNLADAQVPLEGARVRCSKCHHRFKVLPSGEIESGDPPAPDSSIDNAVAGSSFGDSFVADPELDEPAPAPPAPPAPPVVAAEPVPAPATEPAPQPAAPPPPAPATVQADHDPDLPVERTGDDHDLENPEFLFDEKEAEPEPSPQVGGPATQAFGMDLGAGAEPTVPPPFDAADAVPEPESPAAAPPPAPSADTGGTGGISLTDGSGREAGADESDWLEDADEADVREQVFGIEQTESLSPAPTTESIDGFPLESPGDSSGEPDSGLRMAQSLGGSQGFDPPTDPIEASLESRIGSSGDGVAASEPVAVALRSRVADSILSSAALLVGVLLILGTGRLMWQNAINPAEGPDAVRGAGWIASQIETFDVAAGMGHRVLLVRGTLTAETGTQAPRVEAMLLDAAGLEIPTTIQKLARRIDGPELDSDGFGRWLEDPLLEAADAALGATRARPGEGFTLLIVDPPADARRFRIDLLSGSRGSAAGEPPIEPGIDPDTGSGPEASSAG